MTSEKLQPIKILHLISTLDVGGAEQNLLRLISSLDKTCFHPMVVSMTDIGPVGEELRNQDVTVHALNMKKGVPDPRGISRLKAVVSYYEPDIIQCWMYHANLFGLFISHRKPLVWNIRCSDMDLSRYGLVYRLTVYSGALFSRLPQKIIINSLSGKEYHESLGYKPASWQIIPNGFDTDLFRPDKKAGETIRTELGIPATVPVIGLIARLDPMKDHRTFFEAARLLLETHPSVHFILAGKGVTTNNPGLHHLIDNLHSSEQFHLLDQRHDIPQVLNAMDIASSSSLSEGFPNTIGEAMACGRPCVVTDAGDSRVLVGDTGSVVPKADPQALSSAWQRLLDAGPDHLKVMGDKARKRIQEHYRLDSMVQKYEALYTGLTEKTGTVN